MEGILFRTLTTKGESGGTSPANMKPKKVTTSPASGAGNSAPARRMVVFGTRRRARSTQASLTIDGTTTLGGTRVDHG